MASEIGWYLYAFLAHEDLPPLTGIDGRSPLSLIAEDGIAALASPVPLAEFGEEALRRNLDDLRWLEEKVRFHEAVVEAALAKGPVLPMKFGTIFFDAGSIRALIQKNTRRIREALESVRDKGEWGVKGFTNREALRLSVRRSDPSLIALSGEASTKPPGQAYFLKRKIEESVQAKSQEREKALAREAVQAIAGTVVDLTANPPLLLEPTQEETLVFNLACLVRQDGVEAFLAAAEQWSRSHAEEGFRLGVTGPWPPYHFVPQLGDEG